LPFYTTLSTDQQTAHSINNDGLIHKLIAKGGDKLVIAGDKIKGPKLPPFEEKSDDIDSNLRRFERHVEAHNWHKTIWATHLSALLKGNALDVYAFLPSVHDITLSRVLVIAVHELFLLPY
jgi:hypothetical protein